MKKIVVVCEKVEAKVPYDSSQAKIWKRERQLDVANAFLGAFPDGSREFQKHHRCQAKVHWLTEWDRVPFEPDMIMGWGWGPRMKYAHAHWPERVVVADLGFWGRRRYEGPKGSGTFKIGVGDRWMPLRWSHDKDPEGRRLAHWGLTVEKSRPAGRRVMVAGMSEKGAPDWGFAPGEWELNAARRLLKAGATVVYRPKPHRHRYKPEPIPGTEYDHGGKSIMKVLQKVDAVVSHHSNVNIEAMALGLPFWDERSFLKPWSVPTLEEVVGAKAQPLEVRRQVVHEIAWHQWTLPDVYSGAWLKKPSPYHNHPLFMVS